MKRAKTAGPKGAKGRSNKPLYLVLAGLVGGGVIGWWRWLRSVRKY